MSLEKQFEDNTDSKYSNIYCNYVSDVIPRVSNNSSSKQSDFSCSLNFGLKKIHILEKHKQTEF